MIAVVYGTTGELIKLAPVVRELQQRSHTPLMLCTGQQVEQLPGFHRDLALPQVNLWLARGAAGHDLNRKRDIPGWAGRVLSSVLRSRPRLRSELRADGRAPFVLVHGDTFTTVLGAVAGRVLRAPVGHIEAGLRSGDWRNPFPEELDRRIAARLVDVHFAPGEIAVANLQRERAPGAIVNTAHNTVRDAVQLAEGRAAPGVELPGEPFGLVSLHRFELLERESRLRSLLEVLREASRRRPLLFIDHSTTAAIVNRSPRLRGLFDKRFRRIPRQPYLQFIALLRSSEFLVTDSGGSQEECAFLGLPCLIHRAVSERYDGLGGSVVLSRMDLNVVRSFLRDPEHWRTAAGKNEVGPTRIIVDELVRRGAA